MDERSGDYMNKLIKRFWQDETGQSTTEYILILSVVVMVAMKFKTAFQSRLLSAVDKMGSQIEGAVGDQ